MSSPDPSAKALIRDIIRKNNLKQEVYEKTLEVFNQFKQLSSELVGDYARNPGESNGKTKSRSRYPLLFEYTDRGQFEFQLKFGSDVLIFFMHSNIFEFPRDHEVMKTSYTREDKSRSYCGIIHIFNFLADSFKYNRTNDLGYLIGRVFVNRELHYFIEGKREIGLLYNNFPYSKLKLKDIRSVLHSSIRYTINFDLLTPDYENMKEVTVLEMQTTLDSMSIRTGKRLGFRFQKDELEE